MTSLLQPKAYLFDLDETLVSSHKAWSAAVVESGRIHGIPLTQEHCRACMSTTFSEVLKDMRIDEQQIPEIIRTRNRVLPGFLRDMLEWKDGAEEVLDALGGKKSGIVTNSHDLAFNAMDEILSLRECVTTVVTWDDVQGKGKPEPDSVLLAAERLGVPPERALLTGDHGNDQKAALAAGSDFMLVRGPFTPADLVHHRTIHSLHELLPMIR